ncbi:unannotated protein [freshwater metagenome]|uniref:Unannotated protein n=1 Tax=freshwater metagenome TaxID=449393 RepID=A0A6J6VG91_9ZZZZ
MAVEAAEAGSAPVVVVNDATVATSATTVNPSLPGSVVLVGHLRSIEPHTRYTRCEISRATSDTHVRPGAGSCTKIALPASATTAVCALFMALSHTVISWPGLDSGAMTLPVGPP